MENRGQPTASPGRSQYRFLRRIATGGMAELYLGEVSGVGGVTKYVAMKRMLPAHAADEEYLKMFLEEARLASTLQHPNIVQTYDVIQSGDEYIMVMEFLEGTDLQQFRRQAQGKNVVLTVDHALYLARGVLAGLHYAHERPRILDGRNLGIVHRDVSPQNVFLTYDGGVKLLDFGIAKTEQSAGGTGSGVLKGKVLYMAPEQCGGGPVDRRTDLYAVGVILYQLLTGTVPHRGKNAYDTMRSIIDDPAPSPRLINPRIDTQLEAIIIRVLQKRPQDRFDNARDMLLELEAFAQAKGLHMSPVTFASVVESVLGQRKPILPRPSADPADPMPAMIELGGISTPQVPPPSRPADRELLAETEHALVRRVSGVTIVSLSGVLDERFEPRTLVPHLRGEVVLDTNDVSRITSYGIRSVLSVLSETRGAVENLYHVRCSPSFINQVTMIRALLAGGRILSFHAPFIDVANNANFSVLLQGDVGYEAVRHHDLPAVPCPSDPSRLAEFDDEPSLYLNFAQDYLAEAPSHLVPALRALEDQNRRLDVELAVRDDLSILMIRRPVRADARWKRMLMGLEGRVRLDFTESPAASSAGIESFVQALVEVALQLRSVEMVGAPLALCESAARQDSLRGLVQVSSVQVDARCVDCSTERRVMLDADRLRESSPVLVASGCGRCGGTLAVTSEFQDLDTLAHGPRLDQIEMFDPASRAAAPGGCARLVGLALLVTGGALVATLSAWVV